MIIFWGGVSLILIVLFVLNGTIRSKFKDIYNPIKMYNNDYESVEVDNIKTRKIFIR